MHIRCKTGHEELLPGLQHEASLSFKQALELVDIGAVYVQGQRVKVESFTATLSAGDYLRVHLEPRRFTLPTKTPRQLVVADEPDFLVSIKPAGLPTHATLDNVKENLVAYLAEFGPLWPVHRLDQITMGLIVLAKNTQFTKQFQQWQKQGLVEKIYHAYTQHPVPIGRHVHYTPVGSKPPRTMQSNAAPGEQRCELEVLSCQPRHAAQASADVPYQSRIRLITGRTHQIRAQLAALGCPLIGDQIYGSPEKTLLQPSPLLSSDLSFPKTVNQRWSFHFDPATWSIES